MEVLVLADAIILTQEQLEEQLVYWQKVLRLQDWRIKARILRERDFCNPGSQGECDWSLSTKTAIIRILDPVDYSPDCAWPQDIEQVLVHELLHLHFASFDAESSTAERVAQEQAIDCIATGLVGLYRNQQPSAGTLRGDTDGR